MSEEEYDRNLYASGMPNRLVITGVTPNSPAQNAGLAVGDIIITFNGRRVFDWLDMRLSQANVPELVAMELQRDNDIYQALVPPGPLGIQTNPVMQEPI
jgi:S1-C subfamily serine protease